MPGRIVYWYRIILLNATLVTCCGCHAALVRAQDQPNELVIRYQRVAGQLEVRAGDELFCRFVTSKTKKPFVFPLQAPGNVSITRHYPMRADVDGEAHDHPHHKSFWIAHGNVNGFDFWSEKQPIVNRVLQATATGIVWENEWRVGDRALLEEQTHFQFRAFPEYRWIDATVQLTPAAGSDPVVMGDTKEGFFAVRTHPALRLVGVRGNADAATGTAINSRGQSGPEIWGQKAAWVYYRGTIDGVEYGLAIFDHPDNLRHPTTWHARDYGLIAANPFGLHHFLSKPKGQGEITLTKDETLRLKYRLLITRGIWTADLLQKQFKSFAETQQSIPNSND